MNNLLENDLFSYYAKFLEYKNMVTGKPGIICVLEDDFFACDINVVIDTKRFNISGTAFPEEYGGYLINVIDIYAFCDSLQNLMDDKVLNEPLLWEPDSTLSCIESLLSSYKQIIRDYENDLESSRSRSVAN